MENAQHNCNCSFDNALWARAFAEILVRLGCRQGVCCPGARSGPVSLAFAGLGDGFELIPALDERSGAFFALGLAKKSHKPVLLLCTSGTAAAHFFPAVIEAHHSRVPLFIVTADRPMELLHCGARQTTVQNGLYGNFVALSHSLPTAERVCLPALRHALISAYTLSINEQLPVHLNLPMREPLFSPESWERAQQKAEALEPLWEAVQAPLLTRKTLEAKDLEALQQEWLRYERGLIVVGPHCPKNPKTFCQAIGKLSNALGWPILADALGPLRFSGQNGLITASECLLEDRSSWSTWAPDAVLAVGAPPINRVIRTFLETLPAQRTWLVCPSGGPLPDPLHRGVLAIHASLESLAEGLPEASKWPPFAHGWQKADDTARKRLNAALEPMETLFEGKLPYVLQKCLPESTPLFIANSMPVRDFNLFSGPNALHWQPFGNRGVDGIDGTLSMALALAHKNRPTVLICGDLSFLHDSNGLLLAKELQGSLTVLLINNSGGGIFHYVPTLHGAHEAHFDRFIRTPQVVDFEGLTRAHGIMYRKISTWQDLEKFLPHALRSPGVQVLEIPTNSRSDTLLRRRLLKG